jgi:hypothetical protein
MFAKEANKFAFSKMWSYYIRVRNSAKRKTIEAFVQTRTRNKRHLPLFYLIQLTRLVFVIKVYCKDANVTLQICEDLC